MTGLLQNWKKGDKIRTKGRLLKGNRNDAKK